MKSKKIYILLFSITLIAIGSVVILFVTSEDIIHHRNNFVRRFSFQVERIYQIDLIHNSFYFAGTNEDSIYLGSYVAPLVMNVVDKKLLKIKKRMMQIDRMDLPFRSVEVRVNNNCFFLMDGTVPCVFRGKTKDLKGKLLSTKTPYFSNSQVIDSATIAYRTNKLNGESVLGISSFTNNINNTVNPNLLQKQIDGNFDVDGRLQYDYVAKKLVYVYLYRNQYIVADQNLTLNYRGKTIDTVSKAQIKITLVKSNGQKKMSAPPLIVNQASTTYNGLLFINSKLIGRYEDISTWDQASVVDVYDLKKRSYIASLYVYNIEHKKLRAIFVRDNILYAFVGHHLVGYKLTDMITKHYIK